MGNQPCKAPYGSAALAPRHWHLVRKSSKFRRRRQIFGPGDLTEMEQGIRSGGTWEVSIPSELVTFTVVIRVIACYNLHAMTYHIGSFRGSCPSYIPVITPTGHPRTYPLATKSFSGGNSCSSSSSSESLCCTQVHISGPNLLKKGITYTH